jgi:phage terminase Nu1 subunit (DNA packaging protein)
MSRSEEGDMTRFNQLDLTQMRLLGQLSPAQRLQTMLEARELAVGLIRGRLHRRFPNLSQQEINMKLLEELARADRKHPRL